MKSNNDKINEHIFPRFNNVVGKIIQSVALSCTTTKETKNIQRSMFQLSTTK